jgi:hypothetical protein
METTRLLLSLCWGPHIRHRLPLGAHAGHDYRAAQHRVGRLLPSAPPIRVHLHRDCRSHLCRAPAMALSSAPVRAESLPHRPSTVYPTGVASLAAECEPESPPANAPSVAQCPLAAATAASPSRAGHSRARVVFLIRAARRHRNVQPPVSATSAPIAEPGRRPVQYLR